MRSIGFPELIVLLVFFFVLPWFVLRKFYRLLSEINRNLAGVR